MGRFDYVKYDDTAVKLQGQVKEIMLQLEPLIDQLGNLSVTKPESIDKQLIGRVSRSKAVAITKLEEFYMWVGKAIRDDQLIRNGKAELQEERG